jgi:dipeptidyl aminopeptidase/acylaminoacyl peptidase
MKLRLSLLASLMLALSAAGQKKPLDHSVYDAWESLGERRVSPDGNWVAYVTDVQEGDGWLTVVRADGSDRRVFPRGYALAFGPDSRQLVFRIRAPYAQTRQARIRKARPDDMPRDSLAILLLGTDSLVRYARVKAYRMPDDDPEGWLALHLDKPVADSSSRTKPSSDSGRTVRKDAAEGASPGEALTNGGAEAFTALGSDAEGDPATATGGEGTDLVLRHLPTGEQHVLPSVSDFLWNRNGRILVVEGTASRSRAGSRNTVSVWRTLERRADTISRGANDYRSFAADDAGRQVAFVAERDSSAKALQRFYKLWYWRNGNDTARLAVDRHRAGMPVNWSVSEHANVSFSRSGARLLFGTAPVRPPRDTSLPDIDQVRVDIWHHNDEYLQPQQLRNLDRELKRNYLAVLHLGSDRMVQLADPGLPQVTPSAEGDGDIFTGSTDASSRRQSQWRGRTFDDVYAVHVADGSRTAVVKGLNGNASPSPAGRYIWWYDASSRRYHTWSDGKARAVSGQVPTALHDERFDMPDDPTPYGPMRWTAGDSSLLVYDRYDIWRLDPEGRRPPVCITACRGRASGTVYRYVALDPEERFLKPGATLLLRSFHEASKASGLARTVLVDDRSPKGPPPTALLAGDFQLGQVLKAKHAERYVYTKETYVRSPDLHVSTDLVSDLRLSRLNPRQDGYNWGTAELFTWKAYNGRTATGILYKPEDFDPKKRYPLIAYFYERLSDGLHTYLPPAPTPSRLNISFFVSRGYLVLAPDIEYRNGYPGRSAFDYVVSGVRAVVRRGWADSTRMGLQGQSWGGYQAAYIITRTPLFRAAWAGAPVANMTSAYGGIRWESGLNRQFQYEHSQSRIGATLWEKPALYIENSPLFHLDRVRTPLVIMANDADGAVPWYQGIEFFTAMRRLGKPVWMLNYNGEAHNLVERRNRKDIQVREQQFFDWMLKGEKPARWLSEGVRATEKGRDWGLGY